MGCFSVRNYLRVRSPDILSLILVTQISGDINDEAVMNTSFVLFKSR